MKKKWFILTLVLSCVAILTGCMASEIGPLGKDPEPIMVDIMLQENEGIVIKGQNPVTVQAGGDVSFEVELKSGYKIKEIGQGATYENGVLTLSHVQYPTTLEIETRRLYDLNLSVVNPIAQGVVKTNVETGTVKEDTQVTVSVTPRDGMLFLGYSVGGTRDKGGVIVSAASDYTFTMTEDVELYTNYYNVGSGRLVIYDSNGGNEPLQYYVFSNDSPFIGPNALANKGQFTKEGHVLCGYNTKPDGSGTYYGTGWSVIIPEDKSVATTLYAQWMPETEKEAFTYTVDKDQVTITRYKGTHKTVVIPETIDGMPVVKIAANAFINGKFTTLYLSRNLRTIEDSAFVACRSLTTLYFCDTPSAMTDAAFANCNELQKLYMLACLDPRYPTSNNGTYKVKYQRLITAEGKKMIFHAGSNVSYGIDIPTIHKLLDNEYAGVNFGCNQGTSSVFFIEVAVAHMNPGDIVVLCPEYHKYQYGYNEMNTTTWQIFEGAYNAYADVDIRHFTNVFKSFASFNQNRYSATAKTYEMYCTSGGAPAVTKFGVYNVNHNGQTSGLKTDIAKWEASKGTLKLDTGLVTNSYNQNLNRAIDMVLDKGGKVYISFASTMKQAVVESYLTTAHLNKFKDTVVKTFPKATVISDPGTYILDKSWFYNSYYHLSTKTSVERAELLAKDILAQFAKEK